MIQMLSAEEGTVVIELMPDSEPEGEESRDAFEEVVMVKKRARGRPKKIKQEETPGSGIHFYSDRQLLIAKSNKSHYQSEVFVCVSVVSRRMRIIARMRSISF